MTAPDSLLSVEGLLCRLIAIPSVNPMGRDVGDDCRYEAPLTDWLEQFFQSLDAPYERWEVAPNRGNIIARYDASGAADTLLLDVHQDTVPVDGMTIPPFEPRFADGRITGRGAADVKGGMAAMLFAFRRLFQERPAGAANVVLSCTCDEESTTLGIRSLVEAWQSGRSRLLPKAPDFAVIAEPTSLDVVVAHRGVLRLRIRTRGRACHSSDPSQGNNAIYRMARVVLLLEQHALELSNGSRSHPLCGTPTLSVGRIHGGMSVNIVPDECVVEVDRRLIPDESFDEALSGLREFILQRVDFPVEFDPPWIECPPLSDSGNERLAAALLERVRAVSGSRQAIGVPFGTHAAYTCGAGVSSVVFGPGSIAQAHTEDEFIEVAPLRDAAEIYYRLCVSPP